MRQQSVRSNEANRTTVTDVGSGMYGVSLQSTFGHAVTTKFSFNYNNKQGNDESSYDQSLIDLGVPVSIFQNTTVNQGIPTGVGNVFNEGGYGTMAIENSKYRSSVATSPGSSRRAGWVARVPDRLPAHAEELLQGHRIVIDPTGWSAESQRLRDPNNMNSGTIPFSRTFVTSALDTVNTNGEDRDYGVYLQDTWRPIHRLTMTLGVRADFVRRYDVLRTSRSKRVSRLRRASAARSCWTTRRRTLCGPASRACTGS